MGLVFLCAGLAELIGVDCGAPRWGWVAVASWLAGGGVLAALATVQPHRTASARVPF